MEFLKKMFSVKQELKHTRYNIMGIKFSMLSKKDVRLIDKFFNHEIKNKTVLLVEVNNCHYETLLGYYKYLNELGYNVEILTRGYPEKLLAKCNEKISMWECNSETFDYIINNFDFSKYYCLIFNSKRVYWEKNNNKSSDGFDIKECYKDIPQGKLENIYVQHHIDFYDEDKKSKQIILANPQKRSDLENFVVNPHYFGDVALTPKNNDKTIFITVGELNIKRRNSSLLINSVEQLHSQNITNFEITVVGRGKLENLKPELRKYFRILGRVDFETMYNAVERADYFLPLLDPDIEFHQRYMQSGTSGSFQLIYGFSKPCLIHKIFADIYGFSNINSIVYKNNFEFLESMKQAINISQKEYSILQSELEIIAKDINKISTRNLERLLNE